MLRYLVHASTTCVYLETARPESLDLQTLADRITEAYRNTQLHIHDPLVLLLVTHTSAALALHAARRVLIHLLAHRDVPRDFIDERVALGATPTPLLHTTLLIVDGTRCVCSAAIDTFTLTGDAAARMQQAHWRSLFGAPDSTWLFTPEDALRNMRERGTGLPGWVDWVPLWMVKLLLNAVDY